MKVTGILLMKQLKSANLNENTCNSVRKRILSSQKITLL